MLIKSVLKLVKQQTQTFNWNWHGVWAPPPPTLLSFKWDMIKKCRVKIGKLYWHSSWLIFWQHQMPSQQPRATATSFFSFNFSPPSTWIDWFYVTFHPMKGFECVSVLYSHFIWFHARLDVQSVKQFDYIFIYSSAIILLDRVKMSEWAMSCGLYIILPLPHSTNNNYYTTDAFPQSIHLDIKIRQQVKWLQMAVTSRHIITQQREISGGDVEEQKSKSDDEKSIWITFHDFYVK